MGRNSRNNIRYLSMVDESIEVRIARIEESFKSQGKELQDIKNSLTQVTASLKEISKQMVEGNTSVMGYFTSLSAKHQSIDEKINFYFACFYAALWLFRYPSKST